MSAQIKAVAIAIGKAMIDRRWRASNEREIQDAIAAMLAETPLPGARVSREHVLSETDRVDFAIVLDGAPPNILALEVKVSGSVTPISRQIQRYTSHPAVGGILFASASSRLCAAMPDSLGGVPIYSVTLRRM